MDIHLRAVSHLIDTDEAARIVFEKDLDLNEGTVRTASLDDIVSFRSDGEGEVLLVEEEEVKGITLLFYPERNPVPIHTLHKDTGWS
jgi:hypothetical protein